MKCKGNYNTAFELNGNKIKSCIYFFDKEMIPSYVPVIPLPEIS